MGAWGPGVFQNDDALDLRNRWRDLVGVGFDPKDVGRRLISELGLGDDPDHVPSWLALADLLWSSGRLTSDIRTRALRMVRDGGDLDNWDDGSRRARARVLAQLEHRLRSRMLRPRAIRLRHPCDWKRGELIVWRMVDGGSAVFRVVGLDPKWGAGGSPIVELVGVAGAEGRVVADDAARAQARTVAHGLKLTNGRRWVGKRFKIGVFQPGEYSARSVRRLSPPPRRARVAKTRVAPVGIRWGALDELLLAAFALPWPRGAILRVPAAASHVWLVVVDVTSRAGAPAIVCEILDWHEERDPSPADLRTVDVHRTADTVPAVLARVVDPRNRLSVTRMKQHLGVRDVNERAPFRVMLAGYRPEGVSVIGRRRVVVPTSGANIVAWENLEMIVERLRAGAGQPAMDDLDPAPWG